MSSVGSIREWFLPRRTKRYRALLVFAILTLLIQQFTYPGRAGAMSQDCYYVGHCYSIRFGAPTAATGVFMNEHNNSMTEGGISSSTFPTFITSEMWLQDPAYANYWIEEGLVNGWDHYIDQVVYAYFTYNQATDGTSTGWWYIDYTVPDGTTHYYQISRAPTVNAWLVFLDGQVRHTTRDLGFWTGQPVVGGECYCDAPNEHADNFDIYTTAEDDVGTISTYPASSYTVHPGMTGNDYGNYWSWSAP